MISSEIAAKKCYMTTNFRRKKELKFVCFDSPVADASSSAPRLQLIDVNVKNKTSRLRIGLHLLATIL